MTSTSVEPGRRLTARTATVTATVQVLARVLGLGLAIAATAVVTRELGPVRYADWGTVLSLAIMVGFVLDPGLAPVVVRRLAQGGARAPAPASLLVLRLALAVGAWLVIAAGTLALRGPDAFVLALVLGGQLIPRAVVMNVGTWMQAEHRLHRQSVIEVATTAGGLGLLVLAARAGAEPATLAACGVLAPAVVLAGLMQRELRRLPSARGRDRAHERERVRSVLREAAPLAGAIVLVSLYTRVNVVFVNAAEDDRGVAAFLFAFQFIEQSLVVASIVAAALLPLLAVRAQETRPAGDPVVREFFLATAALGALGALALMAAAEPLVVLIAGEAFRPGVDDLVLLAPTCLALFMNLFVAYLFVAAGESSRYLRLSLIGLIFALAANALFTLSAGAEGAARVAWATEFLVVGLAATPFFGRVPAGRRLLLELAGLAVAVVVCSEAIASGRVGVLPAVGLGALCAILVGVVTWRRRDVRVRAEASAAPPRIDG